MKSSVVKRSIVIGGHKTSVSLEEPFWSSLKEIARQRSMTLSDLVAQIDEQRGDRSNLSSAIRLFVLAHFKNLSAGGAPAAKPAEQHASAQKPSVVTS